MGAECPNGDKAFGLSVLRMWASDWAHQLDRCSAFVAPWSVLYCHCCAYAKVSSQLFAMRMRN